MNLAKTSLYTTNCLNNSALILVLKFTSVFYVHQATEQVDHQLVNNNRWPWRPDTQQWTHIIGF